MLSAAHQAIVQGLPGRHQARSVPGRDCLSTVVRSPRTPLLRWGILS